MEDRYLRVDAVARKLNMSKKSIYRLVESGELFAVRLSPHGIRIPKSALEKYLQDTATSEK